MINWHRFFIGMQVMIALLALPSCRYTKRHIFTSKNNDVHQGKSLLPFNIPLPFYEKQLPIQPIKDDHASKQSVMRLRVSLPVADIVFFYTESMYRHGWVCLQRIITDHYACLQFQSVQNICSIFVICNPSKPSFAQELIIAVGSKNEYVPE